jgi:predicted lipoprotein with Yx(FWY)xxD motif
MTMRHPLRRITLAIAAFAGLFGAIVTASVTAGSAGASIAAPGITISAQSSPEGQVLVIGSGPHTGVALYFITSDVPPSIGCSNTPQNVAGRMLACTQEWPPLTTAGNPVAGTGGVNQALLGLIFRTDLGQFQVTYAGHPLYAFDPRPGNFSGANFDEPSLPPWHGVWNLENVKGVAAPPRATISGVELQNSEGVLGATMFTQIGRISFPVYTDSADRPSTISCTGSCAVEFPPLLTSMAAHIANRVVSPSDLGTVRRPDGTLQVTYQGHPLYLYSNETILFPGGPPFFVGNGNGIMPSTGGSMHLVGICLC